MMRCCWAADGMAPSERPFLRLKRPAKRSLMAVSAIADSGDPWPLRLVSLTNNPNHKNRFAVGIISSFGNRRSRMGERDLPPSSRFQGDTPPSANGTPPAGRHPRTARVAVGEWMASCATRAPTTSYPGPLVTPGHPARLPTSYNSCGCHKVSRRGMSYLYPHARTMDGRTRKEGGRRM